MWRRGTTTSLLVSLSVLALAGGERCVAQSTEPRESVPAPERLAPIDPREVDRSPEPARNRRAEQEASPEARWEAGTLPSSPRPSAGEKRMILPERQRLLETRLETAANRPFNGFGVESVWKNGPWGWLDLSVGLSLGERDGVRNVALNGGLEFTSWLRGHVTAVARRHNTRLSSERLLQEAYLEAHDTWRLGGGELAASLKAGTTQNLVFPVPDRLSLLELAGRNDGRERRDFRGYKHLVGVADFAHRTGLGFHAAAAKRVTGAGGDADTRVHMIDYYLRYRGDLAGLSLEARIGALNPALPLGIEERPHRPRSGQALYLGREWELGSAGLMVEKVGSSPVRYGISLNLPLGSVGQTIGNFLGHYHRRDRSFKAQLPLGTLLLGQRPEPPVDGERVGTIRATRVYRTGSYLGGDDHPLNYEYVVDREGETDGPGLVRVIRQGPRYLWDTGAISGPGFSGSTRLTSSFRQDVTYEFYRVGGRKLATLTGRVVEAAHPDREITTARVVRLDADAQERAVPTTGGLFRLEERLGAEPREVKLMVSAPGYLDEIVTATLSPGQARTVEVRMKPAVGGLLVQLVDAETGAPIPEAEVHIGPAGEKPTVSLTDAQGTARADTLAPGRYQVSTYAPRYYDQKAETAVGAAGSERLVLRLKPRPGSVAGRVLDRNGKPVVGAAVTLSDAEGRGYGAMSTLSDGTFGTTGLKPGVYTVSVRAPGGGTGEATATVKAGEIETVEITLK